MSEPDKKKSFYHKLTTLKKVTSKLLLFAEKLPNDEYSEVITQVSTIDAYDESVDYAELYQSLISVQLNYPINEYELDAAEYQDYIQFKDKLTFDIHNHNCFCYLQALVPSITALLDLDLSELKPDYKDLLEKLEEIKKIRHYSPDGPYGNLYQQLLTELANRLTIDSDDSECSKIESKLGLIPEKLSKFYQFIDAVLFNDNKILSSTSKHLHTVFESHRTEKPVNVILKKSLSSSEVNDFTPQQAESGIQRFYDTFWSRDYRPLLGTSLPTIRHYPWHREFDSLPTEIRIGTQAERKDGVVQVNPIFECWLRAKVSLDEPKAQSTTHIYFNLLARDRVDFEGGNESLMTDALESLESKYQHLAVITLPADKGLMDKSLFTQKKANHSIENQFTTFLNIACERKEAPAIKDFHISEPIRKKLFGSQYRKINFKEQSHQLRTLLKASFKAVLNIDLDSPKSDLGRKISQAQAQAVWFHFTKYELPKFIIDKLKPKSINFSCKDAIDRGGVMSAYYNLMRSFSSAQPMNEAEFNKALHAAAAVVKGRALNEHSQIIWNAIDCYVSHNVDEISANERNWLLHWRDLHTPYRSINTAYLKEVIVQRKILLNKILDTDKKNFICKNALEILDQVDKHLNSEVSNKRLLLEVIAYVSQAAIKPSRESAHKLVLLSNDLESNTQIRFLKALGSTLKLFAGIVLYTVTFSYCSSVLHSSWASLNTYGYSLFSNTPYQQRIELTEKLATFEESLKETDKAHDSFLHSKSASPD